MWPSQWQVLNMLKKIVKQYNTYKILAEDADTLQFTISINNINDEVLKRWTFYEIDHKNKIIYLESIQPDQKNILIVTNDDLESPVAIVKNLNEAAEFMNVAATHVYRAYRNAGRPNQLAYNNYILIKNVI